MEGYCLWDFSLRKSVKEVTTIKILLISFSGRQSAGNCESSLRYISELLEDKQIHATLIQTKNLTITPCTNCNYECFTPNSACPKDDDITALYQQILQCDIVIMALPTYSAAPPATYFAWRERSQGIFTDDETWERYQKVLKGYIIFGNEQAGGKEALHILSQYDEDPAEVLLIQSHQHGQRSAAGKLLEIAEVRREISNFIDKLMKRHHTIC